MFKTCLENRIIHLHNSYKCILCKFEVPENQITLALEHIEIQEHKKKLDTVKNEVKIKEADLLLTISEAQKRELVDNGITFCKTFKAYKQFRCHFCKDKYNGLVKTFEHIKSSRHMQKVNKKTDNKEDSKECKEKQDIDKNVNNIKKESKPKLNTVVSHSSEIDLQKVKDKEPNIINAIDKKQSSMKLELKKPKDIQSTLQNVAETLDSTVKPYIVKILYCTSCKVYLKSQNIQFDAKFHLNRLFHHPNDIDIIHIKLNRRAKKVIQCLLCNISIPNAEKIKEHLKVSLHEANFNLLDKIEDNFMLENSDTIAIDQEQLNKTDDIAIDEKQLTEFEANNSKRYLDALLCTLCDASIFEDKYQEHINEKKHLSKELNLDIDNKNNMSLSNENRIATYDCFLCKKNYNDIIKLFCHYNTQEHQSRRKKLKIFRKDEQMKIQNSKESISKVKRNLPLRYNKDLLIDGPKLLSFCIEPGKDNIYNVDREKLDVMKFGLSMMFISKAQCYCFACDFKVPCNYQYIYDHLSHEIHLENLNELSENHNTEEEGEITYFDLAKELIAEISDESIKCFPCNELIKNFDNEIKTHKHLESHVSKRHAASKESESVEKKFTRHYNDIWYLIDKYCCKVCNLYYTKELKFAIHLSDDKHLKKVEALKTAEENRVENKISACLSCSTCWFGEANYIKHQKSRNHIQFLHKTIMFPNMKKSIFILLNSIDSEIKNLITESSAVAIENEEEKLLQSIEETVQTEYPDAKAYVFGSRSSYLGLFSSDVDVFLDCENNYNSIGSREKGQNYIQKVKKFFSSKNNTWKVDCVLLSPRVPILKLQHREIKLFCDISFMSGLSVEKSKLIKKHVLAYKHCREMILYLKKWLKISDLQGSQAINTYAVSWFIIFYLQIEGIFPSVYSLIKMNEQSNIVDGWECGFPETIPTSSEKAANKTLKDLLKGFFSYYATFDFQTSVVCPYLGKEINKSQFAKNDLPHMNNYFDRLETEDLELFRYDSPMCIQDPVDHSQNITKAVTKYQLRCFRYYCSESLNSLMTS